MEDHGNLIGRILGAPEFDGYERKSGWVTGCLACYAVSLPLPAFRGLPEDWLFAIFDARPDVVMPKDSELILSDLGRVLDYSGSRPTLLVSRSPAVRLSDIVSGKMQNVFALDDGLIDPHVRAIRPHNSPLALAVRSGFASQGELALRLSPYQHHKPAMGWKFFGREREMRQLIHGADNIVIVGARRIGKSSLMQEAHRRLRAQGEEAHYINVQSCATSGDVVGQILLDLDPSAAARAIRRKEYLGESLLESMLRPLGRSNRRVTILVDEMGNVLDRLPRDDWTFLGVLRRYSQEGHLRFAISCFQEVFRRQQTEFEGPLINYAHTLRLRVFSDDDVESLLLSPLEFWRPLSDDDRRELLSLVKSEIGRHPFLLQYFCTTLFQGLADNPRMAVLPLAKRILGADLKHDLEAAVDEMFYDIPYATIMYVYLASVMECEQEGMSVKSAVLTRASVARVLQRVGVSTSVNAAKNILDALEMYGLVHSVEQSGSRFEVSAPIVYRYVSTVEAPLTEFLELLVSQIRSSELTLWGLELISEGKK